MPENADDESLFLAPGDVATTFCGQLGFDEDVLEEHLEAALYVEATLADCSAPGDWTALDVDLLFARLPHDEPRAREGIALAVVGMLTWLAIGGLLPAAIVLEQLEAMRQHLVGMQTTLGLLEHSTVAIAEAAGLGALPH